MVAFTTSRPSAARILVQRLDHLQPAHQLTHFKSDLILDYSWSFDGKQLAMARGNFNSNVVLISNFQ
jgi:hypothetical protein